MIFSTLTGVTKVTKDIQGHVSQTHRERERESCGDVKLAKIIENTCEGNQGL